jgi:enoyl-CoA hydratase
MMPPTSPSVHPNFVAYDTHELTQHFKVSRQDGVTTVTMDRPPANAVNHDVIREIREKAEAIDADPDVRVVVLRSAVPRMFMAGADLVGMVDTGWAELAQTISDFQASVNRWEAIKAPTIAVIEGWAMGAGCELALACDFRIMARGARIGLPEVKRSLLPAGGGTQRAARLVGRTRALELAMLGHGMDADWAQRVNLVTRALDPAGVQQGVDELVADLKHLPPLAVSAIKRCVLQGPDVSLAEGLLIEKREMTALGETADAREGVRSFVEKRDPVYQGR